MTYTLTPEKREEIRKRAEAAMKVAPGVWECDGVDNEDGNGKFKSYAIYLSDGRSICDTLNSGIIEIEQEADEDGISAFDRIGLACMEFVAAANPVAVLSLLSALEAYEAAMWTDATRDVLAERNRQIEMEGWTRDHDDEHDTGQLAAAAAAYALEASLLFPDVRTDEHQRLIQRIWPWDSQWWKPKDKRRNLVRAAALALAEIERLDRASLPPVPEGK